MGLAKGKHNFWSQLLLSMIAIFALPQSQELSTPTNLPQENSRPSQLIQQHIAHTVAIAQHVQQQSYHLIVPPQNKPYVKQNQAFFESILTYSLPPIRAGPVLA
ncbi:secA translation cis-regulator SecM [Bisgaard Taxon 45]|uniref:SecA translation cis-regulator SecM n=1 Tax=Bisgaard Taxon 45 TaxID=304289 RepID=A0ABT9KCM5_9PAST|nr:secA translation cis-regulator SecM [Bisgaard Taxon 45]